MPDRSRGFSSIFLPPVPFSRVQAVTRRYLFRMEMECSTILSRLLFVNSFERGHAGVTSALALITLSGFMSSWLTFEEYRRESPRAWETRSSQADRDASRRSAPDQSLPSAGQGLVPAGRLFRSTPQGPRESLLRVFRRGTPAGPCFIHQASLPKAFCQAWSGPNHLVAGSPDRADHQVEGQTDRLVQRRYLTWTSTTLLVPSYSSCHTLEMIAPY